MRLILLLIVMINIGYSQKTIWKPLFNRKYLSNFEVLRWSIYPSAPLIGLTKSGI